jgi:phosphatidylglycerophosphate synthase
MDSSTDLAAKIERRPLASRDWRISIALAQRLVQLGVSPNSISLFGMGAGVAGGLLFWFTSWGILIPFVWLLGAGLVQLRLLCNLTDGMVAVQSGKTSPLGELYNEIPDRISDAATLIGLGYASGGIPWLGFLAALMAVFVAYVRASVKVAGGPQDYCGPMAKPHRMFAVTMTALTCAFLPRTIQEAWFGPDWGLPAIALGLVVAGCVITALRRLGRAARILGARSA